MRFSRTFHVQRHKAPYPFNSKLSSCDISTAFIFEHTSHSAIIQFDMCQVVCQRLAIGQRKIRSTTAKRSYQKLSGRLIIEWPHSTWEETVSDEWTKKNLHRRHFGKLARFLCGLGRPDFQNPIGLWRCFFYWYFRWRLIFWVQFPGFVLVDRSSAGPLYATTCVIGLLCSGHCTICVSNWAQTLLWHIWLCLGDIRDGFSDLL